MDVPQRSPGNKVEIVRGHEGHGEKGIFPLGEETFVVITEPEGDEPEELRIRSIPPPEEAEIVEDKPAVIRCEDAVGARAFRAIILVRCTCGRLHPVDGGGRTALGQWQVPGEDDPFDPDRA